MDRLVRCVSAQQMHAKTDPDMQTEVPSSWTERRLDDTQIDSLRVKGQLPLIKRHVMHLALS